MEHDGQLFVCPPRLSKLMPRGGALIAPVCGLPVRMWFEQFSSRPSSPGTGWSARRHGNPSPFH